MAAQAPKKLLILDLNGTLLLRSKHARGKPSPFSLRTVTRPRTVHPRPYLTSFREYIFHPSTRVWLDTMVWSSAQPPSVADMVSHCFTLEQQRQFLAVWARDTLGLSPELYHRKTQTTKDLETPWKAFPKHSSHTTFLLDDSARKAHLHPYNHVCVREYIQETRTHDLAVWQKALGPAKPHKKIKAKKVRTLPTPESESTPPPAPDWFVSSDKYDETLLAVVGILEALKPQPDVAHWIRSGGLLLKDIDAAGRIDVEATQNSRSRPPSPDTLLATQMADLDLAQAQELWFDSEVTVGRWADQGIQALEALKIDVDPGIQG
ncbi:hypothetical protein C8R43DRAFT_13658 [Mycena crocata]|nr:hypothetical protein C8R43DRAFT_13658 [Mycena crocata]